MLHLSSVCSCCASTLPLSLAAGQVVLPVDLLHSEASYRPAVLRAFGGHVIAATDAGRLAC